MPVLENILDHKVLGREFKRGLEQGREQGLQQGLQRGELTLMRILIEDRFGSIPQELASRISAMSPTELERFARRISRAGTVDELLD